MGYKAGWKLIDRYEVLAYACGLRAGDRLRLLNDLQATDPEGNVVRTHRAGEIWTVLAGASRDPGTVWLRQPDGERHTWDDDPSIFDWFARVQPTLD